MLPIPLPYPRETTNIVASLDDVEIALQRMGCGYVPAGRQVEWYKPLGKETAS